MTKQRTKATVHAAPVGLFGLACVLGACGDDAMPRTPTEDRKEAVNALAVDAAGDGGLELTVSFATKPLYFGAKVTTKKGEVLPLALTADGEFRLPAATFVAVPVFATSPGALAQSGVILPSTAREEGVMPCAAPAVPTAVTVADAESVPLAPCAAPVANQASDIHGVYADEEPGRAALVLCSEQASLLDGRRRTNRIDNVYIAAAGDCRPERTVEALGFAAAPDDANGTTQLLLCLSPANVGTGRFHYNVLAPLGTAAFCGEADDEAVFLGLLPDQRLAAAEAARRQHDAGSEVTAAYRHATDEEPSPGFIADWTARLTAEQATDQGEIARHELASLLGTLRRERLGLALESERIRLYGARAADDSNASAALAGWVESYARSQMALSTVVAAYRDAVLAQPGYADSIQELSKLRAADATCGLDALALMKAGASRADVLARLAEAPSQADVGGLIRKHLDREATTEERDAWNVWARCHLAAKSGVDQAIRVTASSSK
jgi:hypothetical protein